MKLTLAGFTYLIVLEAKKSRWTSPMQTDTEKAANLLKDSTNYLARAIVNDNMISFSGVVVVESPLGLPEIRSLIAEYLLRRDLTQCVLVCKDWYESFLPFLWSQLIVRDKTPENRLRYHHVVTVLTLESLSKSFNIRYLKLHTLIIQYGSIEYEELEPETDPATLVSLNPSIKTLELYMANDVLYSDILQSVSKLPNLEKLVLYHPRLYVKEDAEIFWRACRNLRKLKLIEPDFDTSCQIPDDLAQFEIRALGITYPNGMDVLNQLNLINRCPQLERLAWITYMDHDITAQFAQQIAAAKWPNLRRLRLVVTLKDEEVEMILDGMKSATKLDLSFVIFGPRACLAIKRHFDSLVVLSLHSRLDIPSTLFRDVLCSCPRLESLHGSVIQAKDIAAGGQWVCLSLKILRIRIEFDASEHDDGDLHALVFSQLSRLVKLQVLHVGGEPSSYSGDHKQCGLYFYLEYGLGQLSNLKMLKQLSFIRTIQFLEEEDVEWIINNLTGLTSISGCLHQSAEKANNLRKLLHAKNIGGC
ncbi:hypothetical protein BGZ79_008992 [Entomortierella chlamydospora]|nr:hypothetical protein BGZ79_008992 [Entomortierella chlamydospora]